LKVYIAYESKFGNGKKCVEYLQETLKKKGHTVETSSIREMEPNSMPSADLYIFSSPTHVGRPPRKMRKFLKKLEFPPETKYTTMVTHMNPNAKTLRHLNNLIEPKGMTKVTEGIAIRVTGMKGPLEEGYEKKIDEFANEIN
jgi:menaquinone-dependent protoporphyrinogen IX oxidase